MKTFNIRFRSRDKLIDFIHKNRIVNSKNILVQIFSSYKEIDKVSTIKEILNQTLPDAVIIGASTDGEIIDGRVLTGSIIVSITVFKYSSLNYTLLEDVSDSYAIGLEIVKGIVTLDTKAIILFVASKDMDGALILDGIRSVRDDIIVSGAVSGDGGSFDGGYIFDGDSFYQDAVIAVSLNGKELKASNYYTSKWEPVGREFKITSSKGGRIFTIDGITIEELYRKYLGEEISKKLPLIGLQFPFVLKDDNSCSLIARSLLFDPKDGSLVYSSNMPESKKIQIAFADAKKMLESSQSIVLELSSKPIESIFIYGSGGRRRFLQDIAYLEIESYSSLGSNSGFFGYGEFFSNTKSSIYLNQSLTTLVLTESDIVAKREVRFKSDYKFNSNNLDITRALTNIAKVSSMELQELNDKLELRVKEEVQKSRNKDSILIHNSKLAQMGEMMSLIAHQWRQPLSAITATSTGLQVKIELDRYDREFFLSSLLKIEDYVKHLSETIDDFTEFFKPSKKPELTTLKSLCNKALFILSSSFAKNSIDITTNYQQDSELVTYSNEIIQVLINLLKNGENVLVSRAIKDPRIDISTYIKDGKNYIEISDNGGGIKDEILDKIFDSYFTTKESPNATGLGLYMSKFIIEDSCGGKLMVENIKDGAKFTIVL